MAEKRENKPFTILLMQITVSSIDLIHGIMKSNPHHPFDVQSGWTPHPAHPALGKFRDTILQADRKPYAQSVQDLDDLLSNDCVLNYLITDACEQNRNIYQSNAPQTSVVPFPRILSKDELLHAFNILLTHTPNFVDNELVGLPFSAVVMGIDPTQSGMTLFRLPVFNSRMKDILNDWHTHLDSPESNTVFATEGDNWLSPAAKRQYQFELWKKDNETLPYWNSWNSFFTRVFRNPTESRSIAHPLDNSIVVSANDGSLYRWEENVKPWDVFWFKDMPYSLRNILSSLDADQQSVIENHNLADLFSEGYIFQTYLNPYNFHRWWCPVNGEVLFKPFVIDGDYFNKLVIPDFGGATTASTPYLLQVNVRGLLVIKTLDYGYVCCIPIGMSEVSTLLFNENMQAGTTVKKGDEMGMFQYGGSSFALIFQKLPGMRLFFQSGTGVVYDKNPVLPQGSSSVGGNITLIGSQIGKWDGVDANIDSTLPWQSFGYVNEGKRYDLSYVGGIWTANPAYDDGNLYGPAGSMVVAEKSGYPMIGQNEGVLVGRIGNNDPFFIGNGPFATPAGQVGVLEMCINDDLMGQHGAGSYNFV